jgi:polyphosphate kinase 2 (PPK2 family)
MGKKAKNNKNSDRLEKKVYEKELERLQIELVKMLEWIKLKKDEGSCSLRRS